MKPSKFLIAASVAAVGAFGLAYAQTDNPDTTRTDSTNPDSTTLRYEANDTNRDGMVDSRDTLTVDDQGNTTLTRDADGSTTLTRDADGNTMAGERVARYDRN